MSLEDAAGYNQWMKLREAGLDQVKINDILLTNRGLRSNPSTYISNEYITNHLKMFDGGVTKITSAVPTGKVGPPGGTFVMPSSLADDMIAQAGGDVAKLEKLLGLNPGDLGANPVRIDVAKPSGLRIPDGNEFGANSQWIPGGQTSGGIPEATVDQILPGTYDVKPIN